MQLNSDIIRINIPNKHFSRLIEHNFTSKGIFPGLKVNTPRFFKVSTRSWEPTLLQQLKPKIQQQQYNE